MKKDIQEAGQEVLEHVMDTYNHGIVERIKDQLRREEGWTDEMFDNLYDSIAPIWNDDENRRRTYEQRFIRLQVEGYNEILLTAMLRNRLPSI